MRNVKTIGLDIAKNVFQVHGVDADGVAVVRQRLSRGRMLKFFAKLSPCLVGIEACASSHYWARVQACQRRAVHTGAIAAMRPTAEMLSWPDRQLLSQITR